MLQELMSYSKLNPLASNMESCHTAPGFGLHCLFVGLVATVFGSRAALEADILAPRGTGPACERLECFRTICGS